MYRRSLDNNQEFWKEQALKTLDWIRPFDQVTSGCVITRFPLFALCGLPALSP